MGVLNRLIDMTRAAANELLDKMEDPAMMLNHYVRKAQSEIEDVEAELGKQEAQAKSFERQAAEFAMLAEQCDARALDAMTGGNESGAREALALKLGYAEKAREFAQYRESAVIRAAELKQRLEAAKAELAAMQKKRDELVSRMQQAAAKARSSMPSFECGGAGIESGSAARGFQRMEEKILQWEAHVERFGKPFGGSAAGGSVYGAANAAASAAHPAQEAQINEQLEQLRKRLSSTE